MNVTDALQELEAAVGIKPPFGADSLPPESRYMQIILFIKQKTCPQSQVITARLKSEETTLATVIADVLIATFGSLPVPVTTIAKSIAVIGLERFCVDPTSILRS